MEDNSVQEIKDFYGRAINKLHEIKALLLKYPALPKDELSGKHDQISDLILFIVIIQTDIAICCKHLLISKQLTDDYEMNYFSRILATHCSDIYQTDEGRILFKINKVAEIYKNGRDDSKPLATKLYTSRTKIYNIGRDNITFIEGIRNNLLAHRDGSGLAQNNSINAIDTAKLAHIAADISDTLDVVVKDLLSIQQIIAPLTAQ